MNTLSSLFKFIGDWITTPLVPLDTTAASGVDHDLYAAITALGWQSDVIE